jgi:uncharacterized protein
MTAREQSNAKRGVLLYLAITFGLSWLPAALVADELHDFEAPIGLRLLVSSFVYALCMGWQPVVAVLLVRRSIDRYADPGSTFRPIRREFLLAAIALPLGLTLASVVIATGARYLALSAAGGALTAIGRATPMEDTVLLSFVVWTAALLIWIQSVAEEVGWRGYFLVRLMQLFGPWAGLCLHGVVWGLWYAPILLIANGGLGHSLLSSAGFVLTCCLLGTLLGWLRLASKSLVPTIVANGLLTIVAGLPILLHGGDPGLRAAPYGPPGWLPMIACIVLLATSRLRQFVELPSEMNVATTGTLWIFVGSREPKNGGPSTLH